MKVDVGITRLMGLTIAVRDLSLARSAYEMLGISAAPRSSQDDGVECVRAELGDGGFVDLVQPVGERGGGAEAARVREQLDTAGEGTYSVTVAVSDLGSAVQALESVGTEVLPDGPSGYLFTLGSTDSLVRLAEEPNPVVGASSAAAPFRLYNQTLAVRDLAAAMRSAEALGLEQWGRYATAGWGLDTVVYQLSDGTNIEFVSPVDETRDAGATVARSLRARGQGHYMTVFETDDVDAVHEGLVAAGVRTLGAPTLGPPEAPWGACRQFWVHPGSSHSTFVEFLTQAPDHG